MADDAFSALVGAPPRVGRSRNGLSGFEHFASSDEPSEPLLAFSTQPIARLTDAGSNLPPRLTLVNRRRADPSFRCRANAVCQAGKAMRTHETYPEDRPGGG